METHHENHQAATANDSSGAQIFCIGDLGHAHVRAHKFLDGGRLIEGERWLGHYLDGRTGRGSDWIHLHWHQLVFELAAGKWLTAARRYQEVIAPSIEQGQSLTDAPSALWRLRLAAPDFVELDWEPVRAVAAKELESGPCSSFVELHCLLALAGAGDSQALVDWQNNHRGCEESSCALCHVASGLLAYLDGEHPLAGDRLMQALGALPELGGSRAQNQLIADIAAWLAPWSHETNAAIASLA